MLFDNEQGQPKDDENSESSQSLSNVEDDAFTKRELTSEVIEQEAEQSDHTDAGALDVENPNEPAAPGQPKSIANEAPDDDD